MNCLDAQRRLNAAITRFNAVVEAGADPVAALKDLAAIYRETKSILEEPCQ